MQHRTPEEVHDEEQECASEAKDAEKTNSLHQEPQLPKLLGRASGLPLIKQNTRKASAEQLLVEMGWHELIYT